MSNPSEMGASSRASLIEKLRQIADAKFGDRPPACLCGPKAWDVLLTELAGEAADALEAPFEFPYQRTFIAIADAVKINASGTLVISVKAFQDAFNLRASSEHARSKP